MTGLNGYCPKCTRTLSDSLGDDVGTKVLIVRRCPNLDRGDRRGTEVSTVTEVQSRTWLQLIGCALAHIMVS